MTSRRQGGHGRGAVLQGFDPNSTMDIHQFLRKHATGLQPSAKAPESPAQPKSSKKELLKRLNDLRLSSQNKMVVLYFSPSENDPLPVMKQPLDPKVQLKKKKKN